MCDNCDAEYSSDCECDTEYDSADLLSYGRDYMSALMSKDLDKIKEIIDDITDDYDINQLVKVEDLSFCINNGSFEIFDYLIGKGVSITNEVLIQCMSLCYDNYYLISAINNGHRQRVYYIWLNHILYSTPDNLQERMLQYRSMKLDFMSDNGDTILHNCHHICNYDIIKHIVSNKMIDINVVNKNGYRAIDLFARDNRRELTHFFLEHDAIVTFETIDLMLSRNGLNAGVGCTGATECIGPTGCDGCRCDEFIAKNREEIRKFVAIALTKIDNIESLRNLRTKYRNLEYLTDLFDDTYFKVLLAQLKELGFVIGADMSSESCQILMMKKLT